MSTRKNCTHILTPDNPWIAVPCAYGNCTIEVCLTDHLIMGAFGPVDCPCENTPGWKATRIEQMGKPHPPVKAKGRHKGRIERSRRRHDLRVWGRAAAELEAAASEPSNVATLMPVDTPEKIFAQLCAEIGFVPGERASA